MRDHDKKKIECWNEGDFAGMRHEVINAGFYSRLLDPSIYSGTLRVAPFRLSNMSRNDSSSSIPVPHGTLHVGCSVGACVSSSTDFKIVGQACGKPRTGRRGYDSTRTSVTCQGVTTLRYWQSWAISQHRPRTLASACRIKMVGCQVVNSEQLMRGTQRPETRYQSSIERQKSESPCHTGTLILP